MIGASKAASESLERAKTVYAHRPGQAEATHLTLFSLRRVEHAKSGWVARFKEIKTRDDASLHVGCGLYVEETDRAALPDGEFYVDQLIGFAVRTESGDPLGLFQDVIESPAHDVYLTDLGIMIPAVPAFILSIDLPERLITVRDVPGLRETAT